MLKNKLVAFGIALLLVVGAAPATGSTLVTTDTDAAVAQHEVVTVRERVVTFENEGETVVGTLALPAGRGAPYPAVLLLHGFTGTRDELPVIGTDEAMFSRTARRLAEAGYASLRIDFRGSGESDGLFEDTTFTGQMSDALAALELMRESKRLDADRLAVLGLSQGGLVAAGVAATDPAFDSLVLWSPVANPVDTYKSILGAENVADGLVSEVVHIVLPWGAEIDLRQPFFQELYEVDPVAEITGYEGPMMVSVGLRDDLVTPQPYYGQVYIEYHDGDEDLLVVDGDHVFDVLSGNGPGVLDEVVDASIDWLDATVEG